MKVTGYLLREAIKQSELRRDTAAAAFNGSLKAFPNETKDSPQTVVTAFTQAETALVQLQVAQMRYNLKVPVDANGEKMTLAEAIKRIGGLGRIEKMWKGAIGDNTRRGGLYDEDTLDLDPSKVRAARTITSGEAVRQTTTSGKKSGKLRAAIAVANGTEVEVESLDPALFE